MRAIETRADISARERRNKAIVGVIFIFMLVGSTAGYAFFSRSGSTNNQEIDGEGFIDYQGDYWVYRRAGEDFYFRTHIDDVKNISVSVSDNIESYRSRVIYLAIQDDIVEESIIINLQKYAARFQSACYGSCEEDLPEKDCSEPLIVFEPGEVEKVYQRERCIFIEGSVKSTDALLYNLLSISS